MKIYIGPTYGIGNRLFVEAYAKAVGIETTRKIDPRLPKYKIPDALFATYLPELDKGSEFLKQPGTLLAYVQCPRYFWESLARPPAVLPLIPNTCFIHIRRGDYVAHPIHDIGLDAYYERAVAWVKQRHPAAEFKIISDDASNCQTTPFLQQFAAQSLPDPNRALEFMKSCELGGIAANSTFSWWGAVLNSSPKKYMIFPDRWLNTTKSFAEYYAIYPPGAILIAS